MRRLMNHLMNSTILREGEGGAGGAGEGGGEGGTPAATPPTRPDGLGDAFWDAEKGVKMPEFIQAHTELTTKHTELETKLKERDEADTARAADTPTDAAGYEIALPDDFEVPESLKDKFKWTMTDEEAAAYRDMAKALGLTQAESKAAQASLAKMRIAEHEANEAKRTEEMKKLGTEGQARLDAVATYVKGVAGDEAGKALLNGLMTAKQIEAVEKLMKAAKQATASGGGRTGDVPAGISEEDWNKMSYEQRAAYQAERAKAAA